MARDEDEQSASKAAAIAEPTPAAFLRSDDAMAQDDRERDLIRLWNEMDGLKHSPAYAALLGEPSWRERLVTVRQSLNRPYWRIALPLAPAGAAAALAVYLIAPGGAVQDYRSGAQAQEIILPDQSRVTLAPDSRVDFGIVDGRRVATLVGEARFAVAHDAARPFLVKVGDAQVRVVGTQFTLRYRGPCAQLSVHSGTVDMQSPSMAPRRLNAGEETVTVDEGGSRRDCRTAQLRWSYVDVPLSTVVQDAGRFYARRIVIRAPEIANERVTMTFRGEEIARIIDLIPEIIDARIDQGTDGTVYIDRKR